MTTNLGETADPAVLIPGNPGVVHETAWRMTTYGDVLHEAGSGLQRINTADGWSGKAADAFRDTFNGQPVKWLEAGDCFHEAGSAVKDYALTFEWARKQAVEAISLWDSAEAAKHQAELKYARRLNKLISMRQQQ